MNKGRFTINVAGIAALVLMSAGCDYMVAKEKPPANSAISQAIGEMYARSAPEIQVSKSTVMGKHYRPAQASWKVIACVDFVLNEADSGRDCNDSFELYKVDSGKWMVNGTINGGYLWLEMANSPAANPGS